MRMLVAILNRTLAQQVPAAPGLGASALTLSELLLLNRWSDKDLVEVLAFVRWLEPPVFSCAPSARCTDCYL